MRVSFAQANFEMLLDSVCGLVALLSSQFYTEDFAPGASFLVVGGSTDGFDSGIGGYFRIRFPSDWPSDQVYSFTVDEWRQMKDEHDPFTNIFD